MEKQAAKLYDDRTIVISALFEILRLLDEKPS